MFLTYAFTAVIFIALMLQLAVDQAPDLPESKGNMAARRVLIAGLFVIFCWMMRNCLHGFELIDPFTMFGLTLISLAEIAFCVNRLFSAQFGSAIPRTNFLKRSRYRRREKTQ